MFSGRWDEGNIFALTNQTDSRIPLRVKNFGTQEKYITVNGHVQPAHSMKQYVKVSLRSENFRHEVQRLRFINAAGHNFIFPVFPSSCDVKIIAMDGIYLPKPKETNRLILNPGLCVPIVGITSQALVLM